MAGLPGMPGKGGNNNNNKGGGNKGTWRKLGSLWVDKNDLKKGSDNPRYYVSADDYHGQLFYFDKEKEQYFKVKFIALKEPKKSENAKKDLPENLVSNLTLNIDNNDAAEEVE